MDNLDDNVFKDDVDWAGRLYAAESEVVKLKIALKLNLEGWEKDRKLLERILRSEPGRQIGLDD